MPNPLITIGGAVGDRTGEIGPRGWFQKINRLENPDGIVNVGSGDYTGTKEQKITAAIADAVATGKTAAWVPASMLPYTASLVTYNTAVRMIREGGNHSVNDWRAYGAAGDGVTDDTLAIQAAVNGAQVNKDPCYGPAGTYNVTAAVLVSGDYFRWQQPQGCILLDNAPNGPAVQFSNTQMQHLTVDGLRVRAGASKHRAPGVQFGASGKTLNRFAVRDMFFDGNSVLGDGIWVINAFEGSFSDGFFFGQGGGIGFVITCPDFNSGNINFRNIMATTTPILFLVQEQPGQTNLMNSLHFDNCKLARLPTISTNKFFAGTSAGVASIGATTVALTGGQGANYAANDWVVFVSISGNKIWVDKVASVSTDTLTLTAPGGLPFALAANDPCIVGNWMTVLGPNIRAVQYTVPHWERTNGVLGSGAHGVLISRALIGADFQHGVYLVNNCQGWTLDGVMQAVNPPSTAILFHSAADSNNAANRLCGDLKVTGLTTVYQVDSPSAAACLTDQLGGTNTCLGTWQQETTVAINQTSVQLIMRGQATARGLRMRARGAVIALTAQVSSGRSAGTLTATVFKNGSTTGFSAVVDGTNTISKTTEQAVTSGFITFGPGDILDVRVTTDGSWAPTANNLDVTLYVAT